MGMFPSYNVGDIVELVKKGATIEAQEKILELKTFALILQEENIALKNEIKELRELRNLSAKMVFKKPFYFIDGDEVPFCPKCWEADGKAIHMADFGKRFKCIQCGTVLDSESGSSTLPKSVTIQRG